MRKSFLVFGAPKIEGAEIDGIVSVMESGWLGTGPRVAQFEKEFATYKGVEQAAAVNSCTAAMHLSILAAGIGPGDEVITTPMTFCSTVNVILHAGATPVLADVDPRTFNIDPVRVQEKITSRTKAILPVHFAGRPADMDALRSIADRHGLQIIEDCAHAIEAKYRRKEVGTLGDFGCFSFYVTKNVTTGEGGMVLARDRENLARVRTLSLHGMSRDAWKRFGNEGYRHYEVIEAGYKYNMIDLQAAIGIAQLEKIDAFWQRREQVWRRYQEAFAGLPLGLPADADPDTRHAYHLYTVLVDERHAGISRDGFLNAMTARNIGVGVHYQSIPEHPYYQTNFRWNPENFPNATRIGRQTVSLPFSAKLTDEDVEDVIEAVKGVLGKGGA